MKKINSKQVIAQTACLIVTLFTISLISDSHRVQSAFDEYKLVAEGEEYTLAKDKTVQPSLYELAKAQTLSKGVDSVEIPKESREEQLDLLSKYITHMKESSILMNLEYDGYTSQILNNRNNEEITENSTGSINIITKDGTFYDYTESSLRVANSITMLDVLENVLNAAREDDENVSMIAQNAGDNYVSYQIVFNTIEQYVEIFTNMNDLQKLQMANAVKEQAINIDSEKGKDAKIVFEFIGGEDWGINIYTTLKVGDQYFLNWKCDEYYNVFDWKLDSGLYESGLSAEEYKSQVKRSLDNTSKMLEIYAQTKWNENMTALEFEEIDFDE